MTHVASTGEPVPVAWRVAPLTELVDRAAGVPPRVVAVDGHSASGKTTLAGRLAAAVPGAVVVHTDDVAWWHSFFDWADLLVDGVLAPYRAGQPVAYRPPPWEARDRAGAIVVPVGTPLLVVEGVGSSRRALAPWLDAAFWMYVDPDVRERRDAERVARGEVTATLVEEWMAAEIPFVAADRPWERADAVVAGTPELPHDPVTEIVLATD